MLRRLLAAILILVAAPAAAQPAPAAAQPAPAAAQPAPAEQGTLVIDGLPPGTPVFVDGEQVGLSPLPGPWTLPAGDHSVVARPAGGAPLKEPARVTAGGQAVVHFAKAAAPAPLPPEVRAVGPGFSLATVGYVSAGVGVAALGLGVWLGLSANSAADEARRLDRGDPHNSRADQLALGDDADRAALWANVSYGVATVGLLSGAALLALASDGPLRRAPVRILAAPTGVLLQGRF